MQAFLYNQSPSKFFLSLTLVALSLGSSALARTRPWLRFIIIVSLLCCSTGVVLADSATWKLNPGNGDWNSPTNWNPATVPNGLSDVATFAASSQTNLSLSQGVTLNGIVFKPGAAAFTITSASLFSAILINGVGITNDSGIPQNFVIGALGHDQGAINFAGNATAGNATFTNSGGAARGSFGGNTSFLNTSTAGNGTFFVNGGIANAGAGGGVLFFDSSTAGSATFSINGGTVSGATGGHVEFAGTSTASRAVLTANGGVHDGAGGTVFFLADSNGSQASVILSGNGNLDTSFHSSPGVSIGSIQGDGLVFLGSTKLKISNRSNIVFGGVFADGGANGGTGGGLTKAGKGRLNLTNSSTYSGPTTVNAGTLVIDNTSGSGTGTGSVRVNSGALGGNGTIAGKVTIGKGAPGNGAFLTPGESFTHPGTLTTLSMLTFDSDGFLNIGLRQNALAGEVISNGVTIDSGAQFGFFNTRGVLVSIGTVLTVISNTADTSITGRFDNLPDGLVFTDQGNTFMVSYEGGDGNDLTLTAVE